VLRGGRGHGCQWSRRKDEAIAALLSQRNIEEAARVAGISAPTLRRWLKISAFEAAYREARNAVVDQAMARLQKASVVAVAVLLNIMSDSEAPDGARLKAAGLVLRHRKGIQRVADVGGRLGTVARGTAASKPVRRSKGEGPAPKAERGTLRGRKEEAIVALLTQRNMAEAARVAGVGATTLHRWRQEAEFAAAFRAARLEAFGQASARLQQGVVPAVTVLLHMMTSAAEKMTRVKAAGLVLTHATEASEGEIELWLSELQGSRPGFPTAVVPDHRRDFEAMGREPPGEAA
jgi:transposase-like protein